MRLACEKFKFDSAFKSPEELIPLKFNLNEEDCKEDLFPIQLKLATDGIKVAEFLPNLKKLKKQKKKNRRKLRKREIQTAAPIVDCEKVEGDCAQDDCFETG